MADILEKTGYELVSEPDMTTEMIEKWATAFHKHTSGSYGKVSERAGVIRAAIDAGWFIGDNVPKVSEVGKFHPKVSIHLGNVIDDLYHEATKIDPN